MNFVWNDVEVGWVLVVAWIEEIKAVLPEGWFFCALHHYLGIGLVHLFRGTVLTGAMR